MWQVRRLLKQHAARAWWYSVFRCHSEVFLGWWRSVFVTCCGAASLRPGLVSLWCSKTLIVTAKISGASMFMLSSGVPNAYMILFMYLFLFKTKTWTWVSLSPIFGQMSCNKLKAPVCFCPHESGNNQMPYDLHPFLIFYMSCQLGQKMVQAPQNESERRACLQAGGETSFVAWKHSSTVKQGRAGVGLKHDSLCKCSVNLQIERLLEVPTSFHPIAAP